MYWTELQLIIITIVLFSVKHALKNKRNPSNLKRYSGNFRPSDSAKEISRFRTAFPQDGLPCYAANAQRWAIFKRKPDLPPYTVQFTPVCTGYRWSFSQGNLQNTSSSMLYGRTPLLWLNQFTVFSQFMFQQSTLSNNEMTRFVLDLRMADNRCVLCTLPT